MQYRILEVAAILAVSLPAAALAQQAAAPATGAGRDGSWELSVGAGATYLDKQLVDVISLTSATQRLVPGAAVRLGLNLGRSWNLSIGTFAGYTKPATVLQPLGAITWTPNVNANTSPFLTVGGGVTNVSWKSDTASFSFRSQYTVHAGIGLRQMLGARTALRLEVRELYEKYADTTYFSRASFYPTATVGLSFFFGGHRAAAPAPAVAAAPAPEAAAPAAPAPAPAPVAAPAMTLGIAPSADTLTALGQAVQLSTVAQDADNNVIATPDVAWTSSNAAVVSVNASGLATAVRNGMATITASAGGRTATASVTVRQLVTGVAVTPANATISAAGGTLQFTAQATDANGRPVTGRVIYWADSVPNVATLSRTGQATAVGNGAALILATVDGVTGSTMLTVALAAAASAPAAAPAAPAAAPIALPEVGATLILRNVVFRPNSAVLPPEAQTDLDAVAQAMQAIPNARWEIGGYTSDMGNATRNQLLSRRRALAVRAYLVRQGVPATRLAAVGYGPQNPVASNATATGRRQNMRVEIKRLR
ncbi:MAG: OmpA family protein [Gemmatimonadales bacterium]|jgi:outer membrane protein OmpA-like peptidoglycan-associated protein